MKLKYIIIAIFILNIGQAFSQCQTSPYIRTNPDNYINPDDPNQLLKWDWRGNVDYQMYIKTGVGTAQTLYVKSPFFHDGTFNAQGNVFSLREEIKKDYEPADGWELIYKNFGICCNPTYGVANPSLVLYNRYTSKLRVFIYIADPDGSFSSATIRLSFNDGVTTNQSFLLNPVDTKDQRAMDKRIKNLNANVANFYTNEYGYWLHADFPVAYDPCACSYFTVLQIIPELVQTGNLSFEIIGKTEPIVSSGAKTTSSSGADNIFEYLTSATDKGNKVYKSWEEFKKANDAYNTAKKSDVPLKAEEYVAFMEVGKALKLIETGLGIYGPWSSMLEYFIAGGSADKAKAVKPTAYSVNMKANGTLTNSAPYGETIFYNPGSNQAGQSGQIAPVYNEVLGVFNLLKTPKLQYFEIQPNGGLTSGYCGVNNTFKNYFGDNVSPNNYQFPIIRQYKVAEDLEYVINPAAGLQLTPVSIEASIVYQPNHKPIAGKYFTINNKKFRGPAEIGQLTDNDYVKRMGNLGLVIDDWPNDPANANDDNSINNITYSTYMAPASCFTNQNIKVFHDFNVDKVNNNPLPDNKYARDENNFWIKIKVVLRRIDYNGTQQDIVLIKMYKPDIVEHPENQNYVRRYELVQLDNSDHCDLRNYYVNFIEATPIDDALNAAYRTIPRNRTLENIHISTSTPMPVIAWETITIGNNVTVDPSVNLQLFAGKAIDINPSFVTPPSFLAEIKVPPMCDGVLANSNSLITTRCSTYNPVPVANKKQLDIHDNYRDENDDFKFGIYPNPAKEMANLSYALGENAGNVNISIINSIGATVQQYNYTASYKGVGTFRLDMNELPSGVYFVNIHAKDKTKTLKLSIIK